MDATKQRTRVAEEAAQWWVMMQDNPSPAKRAAYMKWLRESPAHVAEMLRLRQLHAKLEDFEGWARIPIGATNDYHKLKIDLPLSWPTDRKRMRPLMSVSHNRMVFWIVGGVILAVLIALLRWA